MEVLKNKYLVFTITNLRSEIGEIHESAKVLTDGRSDEYVAFLHRQLEESEACVLAGLNDMASLEAVYKAEKEEMVVKIRNLEDDIKSITS